MSFRVPELYRVRKGDMGTDSSYGNNGMFFVPCPRSGVTLKVIASDGEGWDHVSVSLPNRCPTWDEMCRIKGLFWDDEDPVMQLHPPKSQWVNNHSYCLHLWRPTGGAVIPLPEQWMVGDPALGTLA